MLKTIKTQPKMLLHSSFEWLHKGKKKKRERKQRLGMICTALLAFLTCMVRRVVFNPLSVSRQSGRTPVTPKQQGVTACCASPASKLPENTPRVPLSGSTTTGDQALFPAWHHCTHPVCTQRLQSEPSASSLTNISDTTLDVKPLGT